MFLSLRCFGRIVYGSGLLCAGWNLHPAWILARVKVVLRSPHSKKHETETAFCCLHIYVYTLISITYVFLIEILFQFHGLSSPPRPLVRTAVVANADTYDARRCHRQHRKRLSDYLLRIVGDLVLLTFYLRSLAPRMGLRLTTPRSV